GGEGGGGGGGGGGGDTGLRKVGARRKGSALASNHHHPYVAGQVTADVAECGPHLGRLGVQNVGPAHGDRGYRPVAFDANPGGAVKALRRLRHAFLRRRAPPRWRSCTPDSVSTRWTNPYERPVSEARARMLSPAV